jgi:hypothetical protein
VGSVPPGAEAPKPIPPTPITVPDVRGSAPTVDSQKIATHVPPPVRSRVPMILLAVALVAGGAIAMFFATRPEKPARVAQHEEDAQQAEKDRDARDKDRDPKDRDAKDREAKRGDKNDKDREPPPAVNADAAVAMTPPVNAAGGAKVDAGVKTDGAKVDGAKVDAGAKADGAKVVAGAKIDAGAKADGAKADGAKVDAGAKADGAKADGAKADGAKIDAGAKKHATTTTPATPDDADDNDNEGDSASAEKLRQAEEAVHATQWPRAEQLVNSVMNSEDARPKQKARAVMIHGIVQCLGRNNEEGALTDLRRMKGAFPLLRKRLLAVCQKAGFLTGQR